MIIGTATLIYLLLTGGMGGHVSVLEMIQNTSDLVEQHVEDPAREARAQEVIEALRLDLAVHAEEIMEQQVRFLELDRDHDATREEFEALFADLNSIWDAAETQLIRRNIELREHITPEEWTTIHAELGKKLK